MERILKAGVSLRLGRPKGWVMAWRVLGALWAALALAGPASAHHSFSAEFEPDKTAEHTGKIVQVWWTNPHMRYRRDVVRQGAAEDRELQESSVTSMQQLGWTA